MSRRTQRHSEREQQRRKARLLFFGGALAVSAGLVIVYATRSDWSHALVALVIAFASGLAVDGDR